MLPGLLKTEYFCEFGSITAFLTINEVTFIIQDNALVEIRASTDIPTGNISRIYPARVSPEQIKAVLVINRKTAYFEGVKTIFLPFHINFFIKQLILSVQQEVKAINERN